MALDTRWKNPQGSDPKQLHLWAQDLIKELRRGDYLPATPDATGIAYDNTASGLVATDVQGAVDEVDGRVDALEAAPAGLVLLNSGTVTNAATLDIVLTSFTAYRALKFVLSSFVPATDGVELWMRFSTDGGANFDATGYNYASRGITDTGGVSRDRSANAQNEIVIAGGTVANDRVSNVAGEGGADAEVTLHAQTATGRWGRTRFHSAWTEPVDQRGSTQVGQGTREATQDTDAVRFLFGSGNIASGNWALYGYA